MGKKNKLKQKRKPMGEVYEGGKWVKQTEAATLGSKFKLIIPRAVKDKINWWMHKVDKEISGFGSLAFNEKTGVFTVQDVFLLEQTVTAASAEIAPNAMAKAMFLTKDDPLGMKWHWHSHVNMSVFWSNDDMEIIRSLGQRGWILASVFNYKDESRTAFLTQAEYKSQFPWPEMLGQAKDVFVDNIETSVINYVPEELYKAWDAEYAENVKERVYPTYKPPVKIGDDEVTAITPYQRPLVVKIGSYNPYGYAEVEGAPAALHGWAYNPLHDKDLKTEKEMFAGIDEMTPAETQFLSDNDEEFRALLILRYKESTEKLMDPYDHYSSM